jgi:hypothetical protein
MNRHCGTELNSIIAKSANRLINIWNINTQNNIGGDIAKGAVKRPDPAFPAAAPVAQAVSVGNLMDLEVKVCIVEPAIGQYEMCFPV